MLPLQRAYCYGSCHRTRGQETASSSSPPVGSGPIPLNTSSSRGERAKLHYDLTGVPIGEWSGVWVGVMMGLGGSGPSPGSLLTKQSQSDGALRGGAIRQFGIPAPLPFGPRYS